MPTGRLTIHQSFGALAGLGALTRIASANPDEAVYGLVGSSSLRVVFALDGANSDDATGFVIVDDAGSELYAEADFAVSLAALDAALEQSDPVAAIGVVFANLGTVALATGAELDLASFLPDVTLQGNELGTSFAIGDPGTVVDAQGGDDEIVVLGGWSGAGHIDGGEGTDGLTFAYDMVNVTVMVASRYITVSGANGMSGELTFDGIEVFRGFAGTVQFLANDEGMRFEGGAGADQFIRLGFDPFTDIVDYSGEMGGAGILVNLEWTLDTSALSGLRPDIAAALSAALGSDPLLPPHAARDTFGEFDNVDWGFMIVGSTHGDFFYGSVDADWFDGGDGDDSFYGGGGDDSITGGSGADTLYLSSVESDYHVTYADGRFTIAGPDGTDTVEGVESFAFADVTLAAASYAPAAPVAVDDSNGPDLVSEAAAGSVGDASATGHLLANDSDSNGDALGVVAARAGTSGAFGAVGVTAPIGGKFGSLTILSDGTWTYTLDNLDPDTNALQAGTTAHEIFTYRVSDGGLEGQAMLDISIAGRNDAPSAANRTITIAEDSDYSFSPADFQFSDPDSGAALQSVRITSLPSGAALTFAGVAVTIGQGIAVGALPQLVLTPLANASGSPLTSFGFTVSDGALESGIQTITVNVVAVDEAPVAGADFGPSLATAEDVPFVIAAAMLLGNDTDADGGALSVASVGNPAGGSVVLNADGTITFTPLANFHGPASFTYRAKDSSGALSGEATVSVTVVPVNDAPHFVVPGIGPHSLLQLPEGTTEVLVPPAVDLDDSTLSYRLEGPDADAFTFEGNVLHFVAAADYEAPNDSDRDNLYDVSVVVTDGQASDTHAVSVTVVDLGGNTVWGTGKANRIDLVHKVGGLGATDEEDIIHGEGGKDAIKGAGGNDTLDGGDGKDDLDGGAGFDIADYSDKQAAVIVTLNGSVPASVRVGGAAEDKIRNIEGIIGGPKADRLTGDAEANLLIGSAGDDVLGGKLGADSLSGGAGKDRFVFDTKLSAGNADIITDFAHNKDVLALDDAIFKKIGTSLTGNEFYAKAGAVKAHDADDRIIYNKSNGKVYYDDDGNKPGGHAAVLFATLSTKPALDAGDLIIV